MKSGSRMIITSLTAETFVTPLAYPHVLNYVLIPKFRSLNHILAIKISYTTQKGLTCMELQNSTITYLFQIMNTILLLIIVYAIYRFFKTRKRRRYDMITRIETLEKKIDQLSKK